MEYILRTKDLTKKYHGFTALDNVNMTIKKGDIYGFIGKNGAGKTTLMKLILSLAYPTSGSFELFEGLSTKEAGKRIGSLIETPSLYKNCTAIEHLRLYGILYGADEKQMKEILEFVGLANVGNKKAKQFSLGMRQRLGIAIALLGNPEFMVLDEPVNGLDPTGMKEVRELIQRINVEKGITVLISSHLLEELSKTVTKYGIINSGKLIEEISASELESKCTHKLIIGADSPEDAIELLSSKIPKENIRLDGSDIVVTSDIEKSAMMNKYLVENGIMVSKLNVLSEGLEDYVLRRIGE